MTNERLLVALAATFAGLATFLFVTGFVLHPILLVMAVPFGGLAAFLWYHVSGRLEARARRKADRVSGAERARARRRARAETNRRRAYANAAGDSRRDPFDDGRGRYERTDARGSDATDRAPSTSGMTPREAYAALDLDEDADDAAVKRAFREKAKRLHPDSEGGDEDAFKRVNRAYETLTD